MPERVHVIQRPHECRTEARVGNVWNIKFAAGLLNNWPDRGVMDVAYRGKEVVLDLMVEPTTEVCPKERVEVPVDARSALQSARAQ